MEAFYVSIYSIVDRMGNNPCQDAGMLAVDAVG